MFEFNYQVSIMKINKKIIIYSVMSFFIGAFSISMLSMQASKYFVENIKHNLSLTHENMGEKAIKNGNYDEAVFHYRNIVFLTTGNTYDLFRNDSGNWSFFYPIKGATLNFFYNAFEDESLDTMKGISRAKFARALEKNGKNQKAEAEYVLAAKLLGYESSYQTKLFIYELEENSLPQKNGK